MVYKLSVFINDLAFSNSLIIKIYSFLNNKAIKEIWVKKSIQRGHHLELFSLNLLLENCQVIPQLMFLK